jgi:predicted aspartyl protease
VPILTLNIEPQGLFVNCLIGASHPRIQQLHAAKLQVPSPVPFRALIDTGASHTCVDPYLLSTLGLTPSGQQDIHTPSTAGKTHLCDVYDVALGVTFGVHTHVIAAMPVIVCNLKGQGLDALLGRDVLSAFHFFLNGPHGFFTMGV